jgi:hypothetical protein
MRHVVYRLEMLGHSLALLLKQQAQLGNQGGLPVDLSAEREGVREETPSESESQRESAQKEKKRPVVAIIAPATSKGIDPNKLSNLAIAISLLPSLYATRSR